MNWNKMKVQGTSVWALHQKGNAIIDGWSQTPVPLDHLLKAMLWICTSLCLWVLKSLISCGESLVHRCWSLRQQLSETLLYRHPLFGVLVIWREPGCNCMNDKRKHFRYYFLWQIQGAHLVPSVLRARSGNINISFFLSDIQTGWLIITNNGGLPWNSFIHNEEQ